MKMINRRKETKQSMVKLKEEKGYFSKVCLCKLISVSTVSLGIGMLPSSWYKREIDTFIKGIFLPHFKQIRRGQRTSCT